MRELGIEASTTDMVGFCGLAVFFSRSLCLFPKSLLLQANFKKNALRSRSSSTARPIKKARFAPSTNRVRSSSRVVPRNELGISDVKVRGLEINKCQEFS